MPLYRVIMSHLESQEWEVEADNEEDAVSKVYAGEAFEHDESCDTVAWDPVLVELWEVNNAHNHA